MIRFVALSACMLVMTACSTTSTIHKAHTPTPGQVYGYSFSNKGGDDLEGIARLDEVIQGRLREAGLLAGGEAEQRIEVVLTHYYVRSNAARFWAGIMAGRDKIASTVRIVAADGTTFGEFEVETTNLTGWGRTAGLMERHADEIVARLR